MKPVVDQCLTNSMCGYLDSDRKELKQNKTSFNICRMSTGRSQHYLYQILLWKSLKRIIFGNQNKQVGTLASWSCVMSHLVILFASPRTVASALTLTLEQYRHKLIKLKRRDFGLFLERSHGPSCLKLTAPLTDRTASLTHQVRLVRRQALSFISPNKSWYSLTKYGKNCRCSMNDFAAKSQDSDCCQHRKEANAASSMLICV